MAIENFAGYTEEDPNTRISKTASRVTWASLTAQEDAYVYKDKTVGYFSGDFIHLLTVKMTAGDQSGRNYVWALTNTIDDMKGIDDANGSFLSVHFYRGSSGTTYWIYLGECDGGTVREDNYQISLNTPYYLKITRDESVGTYGRLYCYIYIDSARTTLVDTLELAVHTSKKDFRYIFATNTRNSGTAGRTTSGYAENLELLVLVTPTVTTQAVTAIVTTTATGNGNVTSLGIPSATQHGHCWNTTGTPTTLDSKTLNGAPAATGAFTSAITGLTAGTKYYVRAYVTNSEGTSYGGEVVFWADKGTVFPSDAITRVTNLIHRYNRKKGIYTMEVSLGEVTSDFGLPQWLSEPKVTTPAEEQYVIQPDAKANIEAALKRASNAANRAIAKYGAREKAKGIEKALEAPLLQTALRGARIEKALANTPLLQKAIEDSRKRKEEAQRKLGTRGRATRGWTG